MSLTATILRNRYAVWALVVGTVILGVVAYQNIPVRLFPDTAPPLVNVVTSWPGATATDVDREVTEPIAEELAALEGVAGTSATSQDNLSVVQVEFHYGTDVRLAAVDVQNAVGRVGDDLPEGSAQPRVLTFSTADRPIYTVGLVAEDLLVARRLAEEVVAPRLQAIDGVAAIDVFGGRVPSVVVDVEPSLAEAYRLPLGAIASSIQASQVSAPAGRLRSSQEETMLRVDQRKGRTEALEGVVLGLPDGGQLELGDLATVQRDAVTDDAWFGIDGERAIAVQVYRSEDANTVEVVGEVQAAVADLDAELTGLRFIAGEESASFTEQSVSNLLGNVWQALLLASVILFLFLGRARAAAVTAFTMPLAFGLTFGVMWLMGIEFNMVTLSAVILAVGMVVDASVVVLENIIRLRESGVDGMEAAREGADQVQLPVLAGAATTLVVLIPLLGLPGFVGRVFGPLASTLIIAFSSSVLVALVVVPILSLQVREGGRAEALSARVASPFQRLMDRLRDAYLRLLAFGLRRRGLVLVLAVMSFVGGLAGLRMAGMDLLPRMDGGTFTVSLETPSGSALTETTQVIGAIEEALEQMPEVELVQSQAGFEPGMKFTGGSGVMGPTQGFMSVTLSPRTERDRDIWTIQAELRQAIDRIPGIANVVVKPVGNTAKPTTAAPVVARIAGPDPLVLDRLGQEVVQTLVGVDDLVAPTRAWRRDMRRILVQVDEQRAAQIGQTPLSVARQLAMGAEGIEVGTFTGPSGVAEPIVVRYRPSPETGLEGVLGWPVLVPGMGEAVPVGAVARGAESTEQGLFTSEDLAPVLDVRAEVDGRPLSFVVADAQEAVSGVLVPEGYTVSIQGENEDLVESRVAILSALAVSVLAVYLLLVAQFRSWVHPLTVMVAIPLSLSGVSAALWLAGKPVSMPVMVGLVLLVGTVVNNSILLVDVIRQARLKGMERREALRLAVSKRFRPIMMTSLSTVIGMTPLALELALGAERFSPLATAVIGGMIASTLLTMVVIPVLYDVVDGLRLPRFPGAAVAVGLLVAAMTLAPPAASAGELTLEQAWTLTQEHPAVVASEQREEAAQARAMASTGRMLPQVELSARQTWMEPFEPGVIELPIVLPDGSVPDPVTLGEPFDQQQALGVTVTQPVFTGGAVLYGQRAAVATVDAREAATEGTRGQLWLALVQGWYGVAVLEEAVAIREGVLAAVEARHATLERLVGEGRALEQDLAVVALRRAEAEQELAAARLDLSAGALALESLLGRPAGPVGEDVVLRAEQLLGLVLSPGTPARVEEADALAGAAEYRAKAMAGPLVPTVGARLDAQYANPDMSEFPVQAEWGTAWTASLVLTWTLDGGVRWNEAKGARMEAHAARSGVEALAREAELQWAGVLAEVELAPRRMELAAEQVRLADEAVRTAGVALEQGRGTHTEVLDRRVERAAAGMAQLQVAFETIIAVETARVLAGAHGPADFNGEAQ